jgi:hypothetical protein
MILIIMYDIDNNVLVTKQFCSRGVVIYFIEQNFSLIEFYHKPKN